METWELVRCGQRLTADAPQERCDDHDDHDDHDEHDEHDENNSDVANVAAVVIVASVVTVAVESTVPSATFIHGVIGNQRLEVDENVRHR